MPDGDRHGDLRQERTLTRSHDRLSLRDTRKAAQPEVATHTDNGVI